MPRMTIDQGYFQNQSEVMHDIAKTGFWPTTYVSEASPELPLHQHDYDIIGYVLEGAGYLLDENGKRVGISKGDRLNIPAGAMHAEGAVNERMIYVVCVSEPVGLMRALTPRNVQGRMPDLSTLNVNV